MEHIPGILILYHTPCWGDVAPTIEENYSSFSSYSSFPIWEVNTEYGFPLNLAELEFDVVVLHYTLFGRGYAYEIPEAFRRYLLSCRNSHFIAFFQDEYRYCQKRFNFIKENHIDTIYTCLAPEYFPKVYEKYTHVSHIISYLPGYVGDALIHSAIRMSKPFNQRPIDVGYRARELDFYMGRGAQEKQEIGIRFTQHVRKDKINMKLNIKIGEDNRINGTKWYSFLSNCKGVLGVESGVSIVDLDDQVRPACEQILRKAPNTTFQEVSDSILKPWEGNIQLRTISPRHFEAAAFRVCQILFEGSYSNIMKPHIHYIPLKKDFSNFAGVIADFFNEKTREEITQRAYEDLIQSGKYSYRSFIDRFDKHVMNLGIHPPSSYNKEAVDRFLHKDLKQRMISTWIRKSIYVKFPGRSHLRKLFRSKPY